MNVIQHINKQLGISHSLQKFYPLSFNMIKLLNPGVGNRPVITNAHLSQVDRVV